MRASRVVLGGNKYGCVRAVFAAAAAVHIIKQIQSAYNACWAHARARLLWRTHRMCRPPRHAFHAQNTHVCARALAIGLYLSIKRAAHCINAMRPSSVSKWDLYIFYIRYVYIYLIRSLVMHERNFHMKPYTASARAQSDAHV